MNHKIAVIGLGYVGLPLARLLATRFSVVGFDIDEHRVRQVQDGLDKTGEVSELLLKGVLVSTNLHRSTADGQPVQAVFGHSAEYGDSLVNAESGLYCCA